VKSTLEITNQFKVKSRPIGFFDSGVGGISVLKEAVKVLPNEDYIYFGDSKNAPYGTRSKEEVRELSIKAVEFLIEKNVKAIVVACNTATSAAIDELRMLYEYMPIIGIEPALKPAVELNREGSIIIMATPMTLSEKKFSGLVKKYEEKSKIIPLPCPGLVEFIEEGIVKGPSINLYLFKKLENLMNKGIGSIVLGCTHYPFISNEIKMIIGDEIPIIDGSKGTVKQLKRQLIKKDLLNLKNEVGSIKIYNSSNNKELIVISEKLLST
jgi:glutamate racemase